MVRAQIIIFVICSAIGIPSLAYGHDPDTADFTLVKVSDEIAVYERWYPITARQRAREVKATFLVRTEPWNAAALIRDESMGRSWNRNVKTYKILSGQERSWICYMEYDLPWPVSNQDCVLEYKLDHSKDYLEVSFKGIDHPSFPLQNRIERIAEVRGKWIFIRTDEGIAVEYYITTTPSSTLPSWITDPIIRNSLVETLSSFRKILETETL